MVEKKYPGERKACTRLNRSGSPRIDYISRWLPDKRTFGERVGKREREGVSERREETDRGWEAKCERGAGVRWLGVARLRANGRKTQDLFDTWWITGRENRRIFFPLLLFPVPLPERKWTRQMASAGRNFCAQRSNFTSPRLARAALRHVHLGPFNVGNGHAGIQIPKLL